MKFVYPASLGYLWVSSFWEKVTYIEPIYVNRESEQKDSEGTVYLQVGILFYVGRG